MLRLYEPNQREMASKLYLFLIYPANLIKINYFFLPTSRIGKFASPFKLNGRALSLTQNGGGVLPGPPNPDPFTD